MSIFPGVPPESFEGATEGGEFDAAAYVAAKRKAKGQQPFNPKAYLQEKLVAKAPEVGEGETFLNKAADALPAGRVLVNALSTLGLKAWAPKSGVSLTPQAQAELGEEYAPKAGPGWLDTYRKTRDRFDERTAAGGAQNPGFAAAGTGTGLILSLAAGGPKASVGKGAAGRVLSNALTAAGYGGFNALTNGKADLTKGEVGKALKEVIGTEQLGEAWEDVKQGALGRAALRTMGAGVIGGAATGLGLGAAAEGLRASGLTQKAADYLKARAVDRGRKVLTNGADQLGTRDPLPDESVLSALENRAIVPGGTTEGANQRLTTLVREKGQQYRQIVEELEKAGVRGPDADELAKKFIAEGEVALANTGANKAVPNSYMAEAENVRSIPKPAPVAPLEPGQTAEIRTAANRRLGLTQAENIKRDLQEQAKYGRFEDTLMNKANKKRAAMYREAIEGAIDADAKVRPDLQPLAEKFRPVKQELGALLGAEEASRRGVARGATRTGGGGVPSINDAVEAWAKGNPWKLITAPAKALVKERLPSTLAAGEYGLSKRLGSPGADGELGWMAELLSNAFRDDEKQRALIEALKGVK